ncbi:MAG TPA: MerR family transcriptional regulator [Ktedonobacterales bacterium]|nr:MerR family transcriptional regulator [Ktedonobacterales bacterium]
MFPKPFTEALTAPLTISQVARLTGVNAKSIRYYEAKGVLSPPKRSSNQYRRYGLAEVNRLVLLRRIRLLGVPLPVAKELLKGTTDAHCSEVREDLLRLVDERLQAIDQEIAELRRLRVEVERYQRALANCQPDDRQSFDECMDMSCFAFSEEGIQEVTNGNCGLC